ncbi:hypothetical protein F444_09000 [Phytophthora nicotianae P1976]|uniref:Uncharacterized protein n=1 Tax=Phytophthora nicotianae P1976 TaxID=1317066 RepID=A0A081A936_PHYNI|nr:hypothetical protein F444_09000 [Phytophthora nicotianae P1976]
MSSTEDNTAGGSTPQESDDDLEHVAAMQRTLSTPVIKTVKEAREWIAKPEAQKTGWVDISMTLFTKRKFARGSYLNLIDFKRSANFRESKSALESIPFSLRKKYMVSVTLYLVPFNSKEESSVPDIAFNEGSILHCVHVTGFSLQGTTDIPKGNLSGIDRITEEPVGNQGELLPAENNSGISSLELQGIPSQTIPKRNVAGTGSLANEGGDVLQVVDHRVLQLDIPTISSVSPTSRSTTASRKRDKASARVAVPVCDAQKNGTSEIPRQGNPPDRENESGHKHEDPITGEKQRKKAKLSGTANARKA